MKFSVALRYLIQNCTRIIIYSVVLLKRKNMILKFFIDREFIIFFMHNEARTHVAQKVQVNDLRETRFCTTVRAMF